MRQNVKRVAWLGLALALAAATAQAQTYYPYYPYPSYPYGPPPSGPVSGGGVEVQFDPLVFRSGEVTLSFSNGNILGNGLLPNGNAPVAVGGAVGALNLLRAVVSPLGDAQTPIGITPQDGTVTLINRRTSRGYVRVTGPVDAVPMDEATGDIRSINGDWGVAIGAGYYSGDVAEGGQVSISNVRLDMPNKVVVADLAVRPLIRQLDTNGDVLQSELAPPKAYANVSLWNIGAITGPTALSPEGQRALSEGDFSVLDAQGYRLISVAQGTSGRAIYQVAGTTLLSDLTITQQGFDILSYGLGFFEGSMGFDAVSGLNSQAGGWGSITSNVVFGTIPEPSTYALMGLGLVGIALVARCRPT